MDSLKSFVRTKLKKIAVLIKANKIKATLLVVVLLFIVIFTTGEDTNSNSLDVVQAPKVALSSPAELAAGRTLYAVGTVEAVSEVRLQAESGGRITAVNTSLGKDVQAGAVLATIENSAARASLLQAEGAYEAAKAAAAQAGIGNNEAEIRLAAAITELERVSSVTFGVAQNTLIGTIDLYYANPMTDYPTLRITTARPVKELSDERKSLEAALKTWNNFSHATADNEDRYEHVAFTKDIISRLIRLVDTFRVAVNADNNKQRYSDAERAVRNDALAAARVQLVATQSTINSAEDGLRGAVENAERAKLNIAGTAGSAADAQLKQALGVYRAAQAAYEKTIIRTPIKGSVSALYIKAGDYVSPGQAAVIVTNNNGLEITTAVNQSEAQYLTVGDEVIIDKVATGTISAIGSAIDPTTGKFALTITVPEESKVENGSTVSIGFKTNESAVTSDISVPLSAIKMMGSGPVVFTVSTEQVLESVPVTLGKVAGESVNILSGIEADTQIVVDARGLKAGTKVEVINK